MSVRLGLKMRATYFYAVRRGCRSVEFGAECAIKRDGEDSKTCGYEEIYVSEFEADLVP